jgi:hypothetical protein
MDQRLNMVMVPADDVAALRRFSKLTLGWEIDRYLHGPIGLNVGPILRG